jgi:hypothetical protein
LAVDGGDEEAQSEGWECLSEDEGGWEFAGGEEEDGLKVRARVEAQAMM